MSCSYMLFPLVHFTWGHCETAWSTAWHSMVSSFCPLDLWPEKAQQEWPKRHMEPLNQLLEPKPITLDPLPGAKQEGCRHLQLDSSSREVHTDLPAIPRMLLGS